MKIFKQQSDNKELFAFNPAGLSHLPCHVFWKNTAGFYLGYSDYGAISLGFRSGKDIIGATDFEIFPRETALIFREIDQKVILCKFEIFITHEVKIKTGIMVTFFTHEIPLFDMDQKIIGVLGIALLRQQSGGKVDLISSQNYCAIPSQKRPCLPDLSHQEQECVEQLCRGLSVKEIARKMQLSPRTVETYLERSKIKFNCSKKADLISKFIRSFQSIF